MTNQITNVELYRKELQDLAFIQTLEIGPMARKATHERMLKLAFLLQQALMDSQISEPVIMLSTLLPSCRIHKGLIWKYLISGVALKQALLTWRRYPRPDNDSWNNASLQQCIAEIEHVGYAWRTAFLDGSHTWHISLLSNHLLFIWRP